MIDNAKASAVVEGFTAADSERHALVAEVLRRITQGGGGGGGGGVSREKGRDDSAGDAPLKEAGWTSFERFPQLRHCVSNEARNILVYRFLKANNFKLASTVRMLENTNAFRKLHGLDSLVLFPSLIPLRGFTEEQICGQLHLTKMGTVDDSCGKEDMTSSCVGNYVDNHHILRPIIDTIGRFYASSIHYRDKAGHPVMYGLLGRLKPRKLYRELQPISPFRHGPEKLGLIFHLYSNELLEKVVQYCNATAKRSEGVDARWPEENITSATIILDCDGMHVRDFVKDPFVNFFREILNVDRLHYPEMLHKLLLVNCPSGLIFTNWALQYIISSGEGLRRKIVHVKKRNTAAFLKKMIDEDKLPTFLGGTCRCEGGCVPFSTKRFGDGDVSPKMSRACSMQNAEKIEEFEPHYGAECIDEMRFEKSCFLGNETKNVTLRPRRKYTISCEVQPQEDVTWEFVVQRGNVGFSAVFIACSEDGHTQVLTSLKRVKEVANHFVPSMNGELILTWDNSQSLFTVKRLQLRVVHTVRGAGVPFSPHLAASISLKNRSVSNGTTC